MLAEIRIKFSNYENSILTNERPFGDDFINSILMLINLF